MLSPAILSVRFDTMDRHCRCRCPSHRHRHVTTSCHFRCILVAAVLSSLFALNCHCMSSLLHLVVILIALNFVIWQFFCRFVLSLPGESGPLRRGEGRAAHQGVGRERRPRPRVLPDCSREQGSRGQTCESLGRSYFALCRLVRHGGASSNLISTSQQRPLGVGLPRQ